MKNRKFASPIIAGLSIALLSGAAYAYGGGGHGHKMDQGGCDGRAGHHEQGQKQRGGMMQLPRAVIEELNLTETQKAAFFDAQTASQAMRASMHQAREERKRASESEPFDPRQMFEQQDVRMQQMQQARQQIQQQWLRFWDSLSTGQQAVVQNHMQTKAKNKTQHHNQPKGEGQGRGMGQQRS